MLVGESVGDSGEVGHVVICRIADLGLAASTTGLESLKLLAPSDKDVVDFARGIGSSDDATLDDHVLEGTVDAVAREEDIDTMLLLESIAVADECVAGVDRDGLCDFDGHN